MLNESAYERIQRVYYLEKKSVSRIAQEEGYCLQIITKVVSQASPKAYQLTQPRPEPIFGPYKQRVEDLLRQNKRLPRKQRYTVRKVFEILQEEGYRHRLQQDKAAPVANPHPKQDNTPSQSIISVLRKRRHDE